MMQSQHADDTLVNQSSITPTQSHLLSHQHHIHNISIDLPPSIPQPITTRVDNNNPNQHQHQNTNTNHNHNTNTNDLMLDNKKLRILNKQLRKKLEEFQQRLDQSLKNQKQNQSKHKVGQQIVQSMELRNAYKMCEIYKKQIAHLKKKQEFNKESRIDELANMVFQLEKQKQKLKAQIKDLKKINRLQEKSAKQMMGPNIIKIIRQNEQLKQQIKKIGDKNISSANLHVNLQKISNQNKKDKTIEARGSERLKSLGWEQQQCSNNQIEAFKNKIIKDNRKISMLMNQNSKLRENLDQLRNQLIEKDKQFVQLRQKFFNLKKQSSFIKRRVETQSTSVTKPVDNQNSRTQFRRSKHRKLKSQQIDQIRNSQTIVRKGGSQKSITKYPKLIEAGQRKQQSYKWNHHQFNSKIKQVQVCPHHLGHIKEINFRYERGEPNKMSRNKYANFCCEQISGEYITKIRGGFKDGLLRYIIVQTNQGRVTNFCEHQLQSVCNNFQFTANSNQYLGAFFGENSNEGINRIGCLIDAQK